MKQMLLILLIIAGLLTMLTGTLHMLLNILHRRKSFRDNVVACMKDVGQQDAKAILIIGFCLVGMGLMLIHQDPIWILLPFGAIADILLLQREAVILAKADRRRKRKRRQDHFAA